MDKDVVKSVLSDEVTKNKNKEKNFKLITKNLVKTKKWKLIIIL